MTILTIGLMSGTSLDGVDGVLARFDGRQGDALEVLAHHHVPMPVALRRQFAELNAAGDDELHRAALASNQLSRLYAQVVGALLDASGVAGRQIGALGAHGQTVRHRPGEFDGCGYTVQLLNGALLAELAGIDVVCDLRSRDVAAGGQGAPLVPAFHAAMWAQAGESRAVLNLGGIANLSLLGADGQVGGFDCGPGNALMDLCCERQLGRPFDANGALAAAGRPHAGLLARLMAEPYFARPPPKSTGRDLFGAAWLEHALRDAAAGTLSIENLLATLAELTVGAAVQALGRHAPATTRLLVCGGGALNGHLMHRLAERLPGIDVASTAKVGLPPLQVEAAAFAWLAKAFVERKAGNRPEVTGAAGPRILGALYPAR